MSDFCGFISLSEAFLKTDKWEPELEIEVVVLWSITGSSVFGLLSWQDKYWDTFFIISEGGLEKEIHIKSVVSCQKAQIAWAVFFFPYFSRIC